MDPNGHTLGHKEFDLPDKQQAMEKATQFAQGRIVELWSGIDMIARIIPAKKTRDESMDFLGSDARARAERCREFAADAKAWAAKATGTEMEAIYLDLYRHWVMLADEIANNDSSSSAH